MVILSSTATPVGFDMSAEGPTKFELSAALQCLLSAMASPSQGVPCHKKQAGLGVGKQVFDGAACVTWVCSTLKMEQRDDAKAFCQQLLSSQFIVSLKNEGTFKDEETELYSVQASSSPAEQGMKDKLGESVHILQSFWNSKSTSLDGSPLAPGSPPTTPLLPAIQSLVAKQSDAQPVFSPRAPGPAVPRRLEPTRPGVTVSTRSRPSASPRAELTQHPPRAVPHSPSASPQGAYMQSPPVRQSRPVRQRSPDDEVLKMEDVPMQAELPASTHEQPSAAPQKPPLLPLASEGFPKDDLALKKSEASDPVAVTRAPMSARLPRSRPHTTTKPSRALHQAGPLNQ